GGGAWSCGPRRPALCNKTDAAPRGPRRAPRHPDGREGQGGPAMTTATSVADRVRDVVCETLGVNREQLTRQTSFKDDVGADSIDVVELVMALEEEFEITIPEAHAAKLRTVGAAFERIAAERGRR